MLAGIFRFVRCVGSTCRSAGNGRRRLLFHSVSWHCKNQEKVLKSKSSLEAKGAKPKQGLETPADASREIHVEPQNMELGSGIPPVLVLPYH